jgi:hypothetical protein
MPKSYIRYRSGYKYQLATSYSILINIKPKKDIKTEFINLDTKGKLTIKGGYAWDGPSGPVVDTKENMRASIVHDALYQLMRHKKISAKAYKDKADKIFKNICIKDGISKKIALAYYYGLKLGGKPSTDPKNKKKIHRAPK